MCYWSADDVQQLCSSELPTLVYKHAGIGRDTVNWQAAIAQLKQQRPLGAELPSHEKGSSGRQQQQGPAPAAAAAAAADSDVLCNVLLLHVAGRKNDKSIYVSACQQADACWKGSSRRARVQHS
jgi:hypothetical protein